MLDAPVPGLTPELGLPLAELIARAVAKTRIGRAFNAGTVLEKYSVSDLLQFGKAVSIVDIPDEERRFLIDLLMPSQPNKGAIPRLGTYGCLLSLSASLNGLPTPDDLYEVLTTRESEFPGELQPEVDGWVRYAVRDLLVVYHEFVLRQVLNELAPNGGRGLRAVEVINRIAGNVDDITAALKQIGLFTRNEKVRGKTFGSIYARAQDRIDRSRRDRNGIARWESAPDEVTLIRACRENPERAAALLPVAWAIASFRVGSGVREGADEFQSLSYQGEERLGLSTILDAVTNFVESDAPYCEVVSDLVIRTVDQHLRTAWNRIALEGRDVALVSADGDYWAWRRRGIRAGQSDSRISRATIWLQQLSLIDDQGLTAKGNKILKRAISVIKEDR